MKITKTKYLDLLGLSSATLCLIHCLVFPIITIIPIGIIHNHWIDLFFALLGLYAIIQIIKTKSPNYIKIVLSIAMGIIIGSIVYSIVTHNHTNWLYVGGIGMVVGHTLNFNHHKH